MSSSMVKCEVLVAPGDMAIRGHKILHAMIAAAEEAGVIALPSPNWTNSTPWLMTYGLGHPMRKRWTARHLSGGGHVIGWDLGYWNREEKDTFCMRMTIDDEHPHRHITQMLQGDVPAGRFASYGIELRDDFNAKGPIILCGIGQKQRLSRGLGSQEWERKKLRDLRDRYPGRRILYKPKRPESRLGDLESVAGDIADVLRGASMLVCAQSNTAVDACIAGVPVECSDGAAFALYHDNPAPTREQRLRFLQALSFWQWNQREGSEAWTFIRKILSA